MRNERFDHQKSPKKEREELSVEEIYQKVFEHILEEIKKGVANSDEDIKDPQVEELLERLESAGELGRVTKEYFRGQIFKSTHKSPDKHADSYAHSWAEEQFSHLNKSYDLAKQFRVRSALEIISSNIDPKGIPLVASKEVSRKEIDENITQEQFTREISFSEEQLQVFEIIKNHLDKRGGKLKNVAQSNIIVRDKKTERVIDLADILPAEYRLVPSGLQISERRIEKTTGRTTSIQIPRTIDEYLNQGDENDKFVAVAYNEKSDKSYQGGAVQYGDLSKSGSFLALLHEIAHAWQHAHGIAGERTRFEEYVGEMNGNLERLAFADESFQEGHIDAQTYKNYTDMIESELKAMGVEVVFDQNMDNKNMSFVTSSRYFFQINSETFIQLFNKFAKEEREAWAHAVKIIRFLRRGGINLEPELKSRSDIMAKINSCLETYDKMLKEKIIPIVSSEARSFSNRNGKDQKTQ